MRIYLDNCCFNRPFDDQDQLRIRLETEAKLGVQEEILLGRIELVWSYILDYENQFNPFDERREAVRKWNSHGVINVEESEEVLTKANQLKGKGISNKDALHVACAIVGKCEYFLTTDEALIAKLKELEDIQVVNPTEFILGEEP
jgi:predicted nucleic acid-binding protein